jgi:OOP family OmpA-OmpF porin
MRTKITILAAIALLAGTLSAHAGVKADTFSLSPFIGGYSFDGEQHQETRPEYGIRGGYNITDHVGLEAVFGYVASEFTQGGGDIDLYNYRLDALYHFMPDSRLVPYFAAGYGGLTTESTGNDHTRGAFNYGGGVKYFLNDAMALRGDVRNLVFKDGTTLFNYEYTAGMDFIFGGTKAAPAPVAVVEPVPAPVPAPLAPTATITAVPATVLKGQSATLAWSSQNATDCVIQPEIGVVALQGNRMVAPADTTSYVITCTGEGGQASSSAPVNVTMPPAPVCTLTVNPASVVKGETAVLSWDCSNVTSCELAPGLGAVPASGSRTVTPADTTDYAITCTGDGGTVTSSATAQVTMPKPPEKVCIVLKIEFDTDKSDIKPKYHDEIKRVADFLEKYPQVKGIIEGHTDSVASAVYNQKLSERRARAVRTYLIDKFKIAPERLDAKGYGESRPVASNATAAGRQQNRRIQATFECVIMR